MASNINTSLLNENFPVAGIDNDSQGFRDNFNVIKGGLDNAKTEITDLQDNVARLDQDNDFDGNELQNAETITVSNKINTGLSTGTTDVTHRIDWDLGSVHIIQATNDVTLNLARFTNTTECRMRLYLTGDGTARQVTIASQGGSVAIDGSTGWTSNTNIVTVTNSSNPVVIDAATYNGGSLVLLSYVGQFTTQA